VLTDLGLVRAIRAYLDQLTARPIDNPCPLEVEFTSRGMDSQRLPDDVEINLYRVVQQGVTNAIQHAQASRLLIDFALDDTGISLSISDNGRGFDVNNPNETPQSGHFGLVNFRDRIAALSGTLELESRPSEGTTIRAKIPTRLEPQVDARTRTSKYVLPMRQKS
jgi:signal transduction histidine kinase